MSQLSFIDQYLPLNDLNDNQHLTYNEEEDLLESPEAYADTSEYYIARDRIFRILIYCNPSLALWIANTVLGKNELNLVSFYRQHFSAQRPNGKGVFLDFLAYDKSNRLCEIEMQLCKEKEPMKRIREYLAHIDANQLSAGMKASQLRDVYMFFLLKDDLLHGGEPIYDLSYFDRKTKREVPDGRHIFLVNLQYKDTSTEIGRMIADLTQKDPSKMHSKIAMEALKSSKEQDNLRRLSMTRDELIKDLEPEIRRLSKIEGYEEGKEDTNAEHTRQALLSGLLTEEQIAQVLGLPLDYVLKIKASMEAEGD